MSTLTTIRNDVRYDLRDTAQGSYKWSDGELDRHIKRALADYTQVAPLVTSTLRVAGDTASYDLSDAAGWLWCERVEYPVDGDPRQFLSFEEPTRGAVYLLGSTLPIQGENVRFWYAQQHTLDATTSTVPYEHESIVALGAVAYALLAYASHAIGRVNPSGWDPRNYRELGQAKLKEFRARLSELRTARGWSSRVVSWKA